MACFSHVLRFMLKNYFANLCQYNTHTQTCMYVKKTRFFESRLDIISSCIICINCVYETIKNMKLMHRNMHFILLQKLRIQNDQLECENARLRGLIRDHCAATRQWRLRYEAKVAILQALAAEFARLFTNYLNR